MKKREFKKLQDENDNLSQYFLDNLTSYQMRKLNRLIETELLLEAECNK